MARCFVWMLTIRRKSSDENREIIKTGRAATTSDLPSCKCCWIIREPVVR